MSLEVRGRGVGLGRTGVLGGLAGKRRPLPPRRVSSLAVTELRDLVGEGGVDLCGSLRERVEQLGRRAGDLRLAVLDRSPGNAVAVGELGAQHRLVQPAERALLALQVPGIEGHPSPIGRLDLGGDDDVGVELRVVLP